MLSRYFFNRIGPYLRRMLVMALGLCLVFSVRGQDQQLLHKTFAERDVMLNKFYMGDLSTGDSITVFTRVNNIKKLAADNNDDDLLMEAKLLRATYFYYHKKFPHALVLSILDSLNLEGKKRGKLWVQIVVENRLALYSINEMQQYEQGFEHLQRMYDMLKNVSPADFPHKRDYLAQIADVHYSFNDFKQAIFYDLQAFQAQPPVRVSVYPVEINALNTIGICYQQLNRIDSSEYYFREAISLAKTENSVAWQGISSGNLGYSLFLQKKYVAAIPLLQKDVDLAVKEQDWWLASGSLMPLAEISILNGDLAKAGGQIALCRVYVSRSGQYKRFQRLYPLMSKYYSLTNQPTLAAKYLDSSIFVKDSLNRKFSALQMLRASQQIDQERNRAAIANIESQKTVNTLERDGLLGVLILVMGGTILIYREQRKRVRLQMEIIAKTNSELEDATKQLSDFAKNIAEKNEMIQLLEVQTDDKEAIWKLQQSTILTDADWAYFKGLFEKVHNGYLERLREKLPGLTPAEVRFMALSKLGLNSREMASMLGVGTEAIRQYRSRLRKKFNLHEEASLEEFAGQI